MENKNFTKSVILNTVTVFGMNMKTCKPETRSFDTVYKDITKYNSPEFVACKVMNVDTISVKKALSVETFIANAEVIDNPTPKAGTITRTITYTTIDYLEVTIDNKLINHSVRVNSDLLLAQARKYVRESIPEKSIYRIDKLTKHEESYRMSNDKYIELANKENAQQTDTH